MQNITQPQNSKTNSKMHRGSKEFSRYFSKGDIQMAKRHVKKWSTWLIGKCKSKPQWDSISYVSEWSLSKRQEITVGEDVEKRELSYTPGRNVSQYSHDEREHGGFLKN